MISKLHTLFWYLGQPKLYPHLVYQLKQLVFPHPLEKTREEATSWCVKKSMTAGEAIKQITGTQEDSKMAEIYPEYITQAHKTISELPIKLGGGADLELLYFLTRYVDATTVVETGVASGWSSLTLLLALNMTNNGHLYSADIPYAKLKNEHFVGCVVPSHLKEKWTLIRLPDRQALKIIRKKIDKIDIFHYDSDKSYRGRMWAYPFIWNLLKVGGIFISDDINDNIAFKKFSEQLNLIPIIIYNRPENKYIGVLLKN